MSGHSKWSKVKHQKAGTDAVKGAAFTKASRAISVAVKEGGGIIDPEKSFRLRLAIEKARAVNMPKDTIARAMERAGGSGGEVIESVIYEAIGPGGSAFLIEAATANRQRTVSEIKNVLDRHSGKLVSPGAVAYQFQRGQDNRFRPLFEIQLDQSALQAFTKLREELDSLDDVWEIYTNVRLL